MKYPNRFLEEGSLVTFFLPAISTISSATQHHASTPVSSSVWRHDKGSSSKKRNEEHTMVMKDILWKLNSSKVTDSALASAEVAPENQARGHHIMYHLFLRSGAGGGSGGSRGKKRSFLYAGLVEPLALSDNSSHQRSSTEDHPVQTPILEDRIHSSNSYSNKGLVQVVFRLLHHDQLMQRSLSLAAIETLVTTSSTVTTVIEAAAVEDSSPETAASSSRITSNNNSEKSTSSTTATGSIFSELVTRHNAALL